MRLSMKLPSIIVGLSVIAVCVAGAISFMRSETALEDAAFAKLEAVQEGRIAELQAFLQSIEDDLRVTTTSDMTIKALTNFDRGFFGFDDPEAAAVELRKLYIENNENPAGEKYKLNDAGDRSSYSKAHKHYHPWFVNLMEARGYYDIFLINEEGIVIYSTHKEADFATNLVTGEWKDTDLAAAFNFVKDKERGAIFFSDVAQYAPSDNAPASFLASPMFDKRDNFIGALAFQMPITKINEIMQASAGMGKTGEAYLVGKDKNHAQ